MYRALIALTILCGMGLYLVVKPDKATTTREKATIQQGVMSLTRNNNPRSDPNAQGSKGESPQLFTSAEWMLVYVGILTFIVLACQANEMRKATEAMRDNTRVLFESQRPKIAAEAHGNPSRDLADRDAPRVQIALFNRGSSAAYDLIYESWIELLPFPFEDFTPSADYYKSPERIILYPNHGPLIINVPIRNGITNQQLGDLRQLRLYACVRVKVEYRDAFSPSRYANFGFSVLHEGLGILPKYNDAN